MSRLLLFLFFWGNCLLTFSQSEANLFYIMATEKLVLGNFKAAIIDLDSAIKDSPKFSVAFLLRARVKNILDDKTGAIEDYNKLIEITPDNSEAYYERAWIFFETGHHRDFAINDMTNAIAYDNSVAKYYERRAYLRANTMNSYTSDQI